MIREQLGDLAGRVIDAHVHIFDEYPEPTAEAMNEMARLARHYGIGHVMFLGSARGMIEGKHDPSPERIADINTYTLKLMRRFPDLTIGFAYLSALNPESFTSEEIDRCIVSGGMKGIKLWTAVNAREKALDPIAARAGQLGVPIVHHTWYKAIWQKPNESTPGDLVGLARRFPNVTFILAHLGGGREKGVLDLVDVPNTYYDTSGSQPEADLIEYTVRRLGAQRVLFGSDWPVRDFGVQVGRILGADLTERERELILCGNALRILGMGNDGK